MTMVDYYHPYLWVHIQKHLSPPDITTHEQLYAVLEIVFSSLELSGGIVLFGIVVCGSIEKAETCCSEERRRLIDEQNAFSEFCRRIRSTTPTAGENISNYSEYGVVGARTTRFNTQSQGLDKIEQAYRETVMSVPHFDDDYGDSFMENIEAELGSQITTVLDGGNHTLTAQLQQSLVLQTKQAIERRRNLVSMLDAELSELKDAKIRLKHLEKQREQLNTALHSTVEHHEQNVESENLKAYAEQWSEYEELKDQCEELLMDRQATIQNQSPQASDRFDVFYEYLYEPMQTDYPVLTATLSLIDWIEQDCRVIIDRASDAV